MHHEKHKRSEKKQNRIHYEHSGLQLNLSRIATIPHPTPTPQESQVIIATETLLWKAIVLCKRITLFRLHCFSAKHQPYKETEVHCHLFCSALSDA